MKIALILIRIKDYFMLKDMYGDEFTRDLENDLVKTINSSEITGRNPVKFINVGPGETVFIVPIHNKSDTLADVAYEYKLKSQNGLKQSMLRQTGRSIHLCTGYTYLEKDYESISNTHFHEALSIARNISHAPLDMRSLSITNRFNDIVKQRNISTHYQPIMNFRSGGIVGWEALARGPKGSSFRSPVMLFETAERLGRLFDLERLCREVAIHNAGPLENGQKLFLNIHPRTMADPAFSPGKTLELLEQVGLSPENIVFEITERHSVLEFGLFYRSLDHYRNQGFQVAIDDAGAGYAGLTTIAELQPEYIKLDKSLIDSIHKDPVKRALVETTVTFADKIGSKIIAEGIESRAQAVCVKDIGVHYGQGYFLARPDRPKPTLRPECIELNSVGEISNRSISCSFPVGDLANPPHAVSSDYLVSEAQNFFKNNNRFSNLIITDDDIPIGIVMEYHLNRQLSVQYGLALYSKRPITSVMDSSPLVIDMEMPVEQAARKAMQRESLKAYDDLIITRRGRLYGIVSVQNLLNALAKIQVEMAKGTNPLTGLPGNVAIEKAVESRIAQNRRFAIIYADLDHFKVYNDNYGFKNGDRIIKLAADIILWATKKHGSLNSELCHIGGDDFVLLTNPESVERTCKSITRCFSRLVNNCYCVEDQNRGWLMAKGRDGKEREYPLVSISLGVIEINGKCSLMEIGERAAHIKKYAKSIPGNSVAVDRRPPLGSS